MMEQGETKKWERGKSKHSADNQQSLSQSLLLSASKITKTEHEKKVNIGFTSKNRTPDEC